MQERLSQFDIMKAVAIYLVVVGHLFGRMSWNGSSTIFFLHMPVFFFVSGYFADKSLEKYGIGIFCKEKVISLLIPYIIWSSISLLVNTAFAFLSGGQKVSAAWFLDECIDIFLYARSVWFLIALFFAQVFYAFIRRFKHGRASLIFYLLSWIIAASELPNQILAFYKVKWLFPFFMCGGLISKSRNEFRAEAWKVVICSGVFIWASVFLYEEKMAAVYSAFLYTNILEVFAGALYYMISFLGIGCLYKWAVYMAGIDLLKEKISIIGKHSIDIYVTHMLVIKFFFFIPQSIQQNRMVAHIYVFLYALIVVVCVTAVSEKYLKNIKIYNFSVGRRTKG